MFVQTPSLVPTPMVHQILETVRGRFGIDPGAELTLEADPGNATPFALLSNDLQCYLACRHF